MISKEGVNRKPLRLEGNTMGKNKKRRGKTHMLKSIIIVFISKPILSNLLIINKIKQNKMKTK